MRGDNQYRMSREALEFKNLNIHALQLSEKGQEEVIMQAAPSQAELLFKKYKEAKEKLKKQIQETIMEKYGNAAASVEEIPKELLFGQSEREVEYDRCGRVIKGMELSVPKSKYEEDVYINNHTSVWGSWWKDQQWGYKCCQQTIKNSYCTGVAGIEAAEEAADLMRTNIERHAAASNDRSGPVEEKRFVTWGSDTPEDLVLDREKLAEALKKEDERKKEEKDERKRKYNVQWNDQITPEEMEAYRMKRIHEDDPMKNLLH